MHRSVVFLTLALVGCGGGCSGATESAGDDPQSARRGAGTAGDHGSANEAPEPPPDPGPAPTVALAASVDRFDRSVAVRVENHGVEIALGSTLRLERAGEGGAWAPVRETSVALRDDCQTPAAECVTLAPGAVFAPPAWPAKVGEAQCECASCGPAPPGRYRFVGETCGGGHRIEGAAFELPARQ